MIYEATKEAVPLLRCWYFTTSVVYLQHVVLKQQIKPELSKVVILFSQLYRNNKLSLIVTNYPF